MLSTLCFDGGKGATTGVDDSSSQRREGPTDPKAVKPHSSTEGVFFFFFPFFYFIYLLELA